MERISLTRTFDAPVEAVRAHIADTAAFMRATGVDTVEVAGDRLHMANRVGLFTIDLELRIVEREGAVLAYEQADGVFESMHTEYTLAATDDGTEVTATTEFSALDLPVVGEVLDATVVTRQRRKELEAQFDWLADQLAD